MGGKNSSITSGSVGENAGDDATGGNGPSAAGGGIANLMKLPDKFGDNLEKGIAFKGKPKTPSIMSESDMKGSNRSPLYPTVLPLKLVPPEWSEETKQNFQRWDKLINVDMHKLYEK